MNIATWYLIFGLIFFCWCYRANWADAVGFLGGAVFIVVTFPVWWGRRIAATWINHRYESTEHV